MTKRISKKQAEIDRLTARSNHFEGLIRALFSRRWAVGPVKSRDGIVTDMEWLSARFNDLKASVAVVPEPASQPLIPVVNSCPPSIQPDSETTPETPQNSHTQALSPNTDGNAASRDQIPDSPGMSAAAPATRAAPRTLASIVLRPSQE